MTCAQKEAAVSSSALGQDLSGQDCCARGTVLCFKCLPVRHEGAGAEAPWLVTGASAGPPHQAGQVRLAVTLPLCWWASWGKGVAESRTLRTGGDLELVAGEGQPSDVKRFGSADKGLGLAKAAVRIHSSEMLRSEVLFTSEPHPWTQFCPCPKVQLFFPCHPEAASGAAREGGCLVSRSEAASRTMVACKMFAVLMNFHL